MQFSASADLSVSLSDFASLSNFTKTLNKPSWMVRFPLIIHPHERSKHRPAQSLTLPNSLRKQAACRANGSKAPLRERAEEVMMRLEMDCAATMMQEGSKLRQEKRGLTCVKKRLQSCSRHTQLLSYSNQRAPYFILLHRLAQHRRH